MSRACFIAVVLDEGSSAGSAVAAYVGRIGKRAGARLEPMDVPEMGAAFGEDADYLAMIWGAEGPEPSHDVVVALVDALLEADDVRAVRVGWWHLGARRPMERERGHIDIGTLDAADWDGQFTIEVRGEPSDPPGPTLRQVALGIPHERE